jgi:hypothetical protein
MNESTEKLLARLEQATGLETTACETPGSENSEPLDDDTAMLRESWLALGKLLDAADAESERPLVRPKDTRSAGLPLKFIAGLAASLLVAFAAWAMLKRGSDVIVPVQEVTVLPDSPAPIDVAKAPQDGESVDAIDEFAWEDSFDEQLAAASQAIRSVQANWNGGDRRYSVLLDQFEQFDEELSEGSL